MIRKAMAFLTAAIMILAAACITAAADAVPQDEGGKKFESFWGIRCGLVQVFREEEGYRVTVDLYNQDDNTGTLWQYACFYNAEKDVLESFSSSKDTYTLDTATLTKTLGETEYEGIDDEGNMTVFSLGENGKLLWKDGHEDTGRKLEFTDIGEFEGVWVNEDENIYTEIWWRGLYDENTYCYDVYIRNGGDDEYTQFSMEGLYNPESGKLECSGSALTLVLNEESGIYEFTEDGENHDAFFSDIGDGKILYETANGIELTYDPLGPQS